MCLQEGARCAADARFDIDKTQLLVGNSGIQQREIFGDGEVFAIASAHCQRFCRSCPVVGLSPDDEIISEGNSVIEELVYPSQLVLRASQTSGLGDQIKPVVNIRSVTAQTPDGFEHPVDVQGICRRYAKQQQA